MTRKIWPMLHDAAFLIRHDKVTTAQLEEAFKVVVIPDLAELRDAFALAKPIILELAKEI